jgi:tetratricopeptide (TPR) repeat protein
MEPTSTTPAVTVQRSDSPGTAGSSPAGTTPHWHTDHPTLKSGDARPAERLLRSTTPDATTYPALLHAARVLLHTGKPRRTATWCAKLHPYTRTNAWAAAFRALRSEALLQLGDLAAAEHEAAEAQHAAGPRPTALRLWPTAVRAEALIAQGRYEEAALHLGPPIAEPRWPAAPWLRARGRLHLAAHRHQAALDTFQATGSLALRHGAGRLPHLPWRGDIAETLLRSGRTDEARVLLTEELALPTVGPRHRATALRLLAATDEPARRPDTLTRAIGGLRRCEDRAELARTMADLAHALDNLGDSSTTGFLRRATDLAADCGLSAAALTASRPTAPG